ncbi:hypothetical protein TSH7_09915 [Azospirillum sp. TSH7]|uniref:GNAT family N-acetyltransferase n=1 Tax=unclassified Azospirillum TaxID=2630922 RepID=UPI000D61E60E|nr:MULTISPECIES: GNAT family N-acetyltransferase [unclassified Azospirillum]PWC63984.1 hypothetical protein TSH20_19010 [Azospirillum sp. TSH20]PWC64847.1 hypothetical protein TSH7_09915 [Azospirillum sp. TSH7]
MKIRPVTPLDTLVCVDMAARFAGESAYAGLPVNEEKLRTLAARYATQPECYFRVAEEDGWIVGMLLGHTTPFIFGDALLAEQLFWYVTPERRGSSVAVRMLIDFAAWAEDQGVAEICVGITTGMDIDGPVGGVLERLRFKRTGSIYKLRMEV